jgi:hypothetical protein
MMRVMNDPKADPARRDKMAIALLPYFHGAEKLPIGKKQATQMRAEAAGVGTEWERLLEPQPPPLKLKPN